MVAYIMKGPPLRDKSHLFDKKLTTEEFDELRRHMLGEDDNPDGLEEAHVMELNQCVYDVLPDGTIRFRR